MNERWRVALAGLVAALAVPFLIIDSPAPAEGVVTGDQETQSAFVAPIEQADDISEVAAPVVPSNAVEIIVTSTEVLPDVARLAEHAGSWTVARTQAIKDGRVEATFTLPPSETNYSLLPVVKTTPAPGPPPADDTTSDVKPPAEPPAKEAPAGGAEPEPPTDPVEASPRVPKPADPEPVDPVTVDPEPAPAPAPDHEPAPAAAGPAAPAQVNGRVPPPAGGPTGGQWNALRKCESTHNYQAISPSGLYRGAYQFSQQTWDWVAAIHWPHLVGIDPIEAAPAWQDVMAYTLYAMRGWDQWPICGKNLL